METDSGTVVRADGLETGVWVTCAEEMATAVFKMQVGAKEIETSTVMNHIVGEHEGGDGLVPSLRGLMVPAEPLPSPLTGSLVM